MYHCSHCDAQFPKWAGRCTECGKWGTVAEGQGAAGKPTGTKKTKGAAARKSAPLLASGASDARPRLASGDPEFDRVLGGGILPGSLVLLSGEPGIGKSTLVAKVAASVGNALYISGEESAGQLADRLVRLGADGKDVRFLEAHPVEELVATIEAEKPALAIVDSVQTLSSSELDAASGSPNMVRYAAARFMELAKRTDIPVLLIGQVTKDGSLAGPKTLEHLVDVVLSLDGDPHHAYRLLRGTKNRFGSTNEVGVFEMTATGLSPVENPSAKFLEERANVPGSVITAALEGSRVFLVEVQALVEKAAYGTPVRRASGFDGNRLQMLCAILSKRAGLKLGEQDVYVNVVGGLELTEPAADLAICAAIVSAAKNTASEEAAIYLGEVGLGGEVRSVPALERRLDEAKRFGITAFVTPKTVKQVKDL